MVVGETKMILQSGRAKLEDITKLLVATAMGKEKADLVIRSGTLMNVNSRELQEKGSKWNKNEKNKAVYP